jgi:hypothetical protein|uniref:Uncharacterized protein n=1 Tax=Picea glauca TaxID=3330 RepID=A0A101LZX2_PICGL|nr:hypothetical protein ABT39_MTgene4464 [Picea glauca]QHR91331.1 hypothetical protein Q903MT_gene5363 [Picea sitchensis]
MKKPMLDPQLARVLLALELLTLQPENLKPVHQLGKHQPLLLLLPFPPLLLRPLLLGKLKLVQPALDQTLSQAIKQEGMPLASLLSLMPL